MRTQILIFLLLILIYPQTSSARENCTWENSDCYGPNLDISAGDNFSWVVSDHFEDSKLVNYGVNSTELLKINIRVLDEIKGLDSSDMNWTEYFSINQTVAGELIDGDPLDFLKYLWSGIPFNFIQPTLILKNNSLANIFNYLAQTNPERTDTYISFLPGDRSYHLNETYQMSQSVTGEVYNIHFRVIGYNNDSDIYYKEIMNASINIQTGLLINLNYKSERFNIPPILNWNNISYIIDKVIPDPLELDLDNILVYLTLIIGVVLGILVVAVYIYSRLNRT